MNEGDNNEMKRRKMEGPLSCIYKKMLSLGDCQKCKKKVIIKSFNFIQYFNIIYGSVMVWEFYDFWIFIYTHFVFKKVCCPFK